MGKQRQKQKDKGKKRHRPIWHQLKYAAIRSFKHRGKKGQDKQKWREIRIAYERGDMTFEEFIERMADCGWYIASRGDFWNGNRYKEGYLDTVIKVAKLYGRWIQENYPDIEEVYQIKPEMTQRFLEEEARKKVKVSTLKKYISILKALNIACVMVYGKKYKFRFAKGIYVPKHALKNESRTVKIEKEDYEKIINSNYYQKSKSKAKIAVPLARHFALRVNELARLKYGNVAMSENDIPHALRRFITDKSPYNAYLIIEKSKGGVTRVIPALKREEYELLKKIKKHQVNNGLNDDDEVVGLDKDSINTFLRRCMKNCGLEHYVRKSVNIHGLRKLRASELFLDKLKEVYSTIYEKQNLPLKKKVYLSFKKAGAYVDKYLGHETKPKSKADKKEGRWDLIKKYQLDVLKPEDIAKALSECGLNYYVALEVVREVISEL